MIEMPDCKCVVRKFAVIVPNFNRRIPLLFFYNVWARIVIHVENIPFGSRCAALDHDDEISIHHDYDNMEMTDLSVSWPATPSALRPLLSCTFFTAYSSPAPKIPGVSIP